MEKDFKIDTRQNGQHGQKSIFFIATKEPEKGPQVTWEKLQHRLDKQNQTQNSLGIFFEKLLIKNPTTTTAHLSEGNSS